jgi:hypothetical protein
MKEKNKMILKHIPDNFKEKFEAMKEIKGVNIDQKSVDSVKGSLSKVMDLDSPEAMKLVAIKVIFLTKDGVLCETGNQSEGFNEEDWRE